MGWGDGLAQRMHRGAPDPFVHVPSIPARGGTVPCRLRARSGPWRGFGRSRTQTLPMRSNLQPAVADADMIRVTDRCAGTSRCA